MDQNELSYNIRGAIFEVHKELGPGLLETVYEMALSTELTRRGILNQIQAPLPVVYKDIKLEVGYRVDILVENSIIIEIKSVENFHDKHKKITLNYLRLSDIKLAFLVNFNVLFIDKNSLVRIIN